MANQGINPKELWQLFLERYPIVIVTAAVAGFISWHKAEQIEPFYQAKATVQVDYQQRAVLTDIEQLDSTDFSDYDVLNTIVATMVNTDLMRQVIRDNDLINVEEFAGKDADSASLDTLAKRLKGATSARLRDETRLIDITVKHGNAKLAVKLVNWIAKGYIDQHRNRRLEGNRATLDALNAEADQLKLNLQAAEKALIDFRVDSKLVVSLQDRMRLLETEISTRSKTLSDFNATITELDNDVKLIKSYGEKPTHEQLRNVPGISNDRLIQEKYAELTSQEGVIKGFLERYKPKHPKVVEEQRKYDVMLAAFNRALEEAPHIIEAKLAQAQVRAKSMAAQLSKTEEESLALAEHAVEYNVLQRDIQSQQDVYDQVMARIKEIDLTSGMSDEVISIIESATGASNIAASGEQTVSLGIIFGIAIGLGIIYLLHTLDTSIKSVDQAEQMLELPALGAIPCSESKDRLAKSRLVMLSDPSSSCAESFRSLRANLESLGNHEKKVTLFTSSMPAEGKTFACINYALTLAQRGLKTVVVDLDLRHPSIASDFSFEGEKLSIAEVLKDPKALTQTAPEFLENPAENLYVVPTFGQIPNPAEELASAPITSLIRRLTEEYDRVVIDTAPLNPIGDTLAVVQLVDVICLVARCKKTPTKVIQRSLETLRRFNSPAAGVILNFVPAKKSSGNYYYYYGGGKSPYEAKSHYTPQSPTPSTTPAPTRQRRRVRPSSPAPVAPEAPAATEAPAAPLEVTSSRDVEAPPTPAAPQPRHRRRRIRRPASPVLDELAQSVDPVPQKEL